MKKLWNDAALAALKPDICQHVRSGATDSMTIELVTHGLFVNVQNEAHEGIPLIHVSVSVGDEEVVRQGMQATECGDFKEYAEEVIQACFGYDFLLVEHVFEVTALRAITKRHRTRAQSDPKALVYHWFYKS